MASHGIARSVRIRTEEERLKELEKIKGYRDLEEQIRSETKRDDFKFTPELFQLTSKLLKLNPEYYTIWNVRRRLLTSGLLSGRSAGSSPSTASPSSSRTATATTSSAASSSASSATTQPAPAPLTTGRSGTIPDDSVTGAHEPEDAKTPHHTNQGAPNPAVSSRDAEGGQEKDLNTLRSELAFTIPLLFEFPKCYWIWNYRLWVLRQTIERLDTASARRIWEEELALISKMLVRDQRNFHAWGYRRHVVDQLESPELDGSSMVESEFEYTTAKIRVDLSNFSAWHHRSKLIPLLLDERGADAVARKSFFESELNLIRDALNVGPEDQSLWYYHQYLMSNLVEPSATATSASTASSPPPSASFTPDLSRGERVAYVRREIDDIKDLLEDYDDVKWLYEALMEYAQALCQIEQRAPSGEELADLKMWLGKLRELDPMRNGRWKDVEQEHNLG